MLLESRILELAGFDKNYTNKKLLLKKIDILLNKTDEEIEQEENKLVEDFVKDLFINKTKPDLDDYIYERFSYLINEEEQKAYFNILCEEYNISSEEKELMEGRFFKGISRALQRGKAKAGKAFMNTPLGKQFLSVAKKAGNIVTSIKSKVYNTIINLAKKVGLEKAAKTFLNEAGAVWKAGKKPRKILFYITIALTILSFLNPAIGAVTAPILAKVLLAKKIMNPVAGLTDAFEGLDWDALSDVEIEQMDFEDVTANRASIDEALNSAQETVNKVQNDMLTPQEIDAANKRFLETGGNVPAEETVPVESETTPAEPETAPAKPVTAPAGIETPMGNFNEMIKVAGAGEALQKAGLTINDFNTSMTDTNKAIEVISKLANSRDGRKLLDTINNTYEQYGATVQPGKIHVLTAHALRKTT